MCHVDVPAYAGRRCRIGRQRLNVTGINLEVIHVLRKLALAAVLLVFFMVAPALAEPDTTYYTNPSILKDDSGIQIELSEIVASDLPKGSIIFTYPPSEYRYYVLYYTLYNPTDQDIRYQFNITFMDSNGTSYTTEDNTLATSIGAGRRISDEIKEFPVPRNATGLHLRWYFINKDLNEREWRDINITEQAVATPTPTPVPTATATPTPAASPTATPTPADGFLPLLAIGLVASGFVLARVTKK
jgi:hypothetical protein